MSKLLEQQFQIMDRGDDLILVGTREFTDGTIEVGRVTYEEVLPYSVARPGDGYEVTRADLCRLRDKIDAALERTTGE